MISSKLFGNSSLKNGYSGIKCLTFRYAFLYIIFNILYFLSNLSLTSFSAEDALTAFHSSADILKNGSFLPKVISSKSRHFASPIFKTANWVLYLSYSVYISGHSSKNNSEVCSIKSKITSSLCNNFEHGNLYILLKKTEDSLPFSWITANISESTSSLK